MQTLRVAVVQVLGFVGIGRCRKVLVKFSTDQNTAMSRAVAESLEKLTASSVLVAF
jgi:RNase P/RNase MRP subunit POP5